MPPFLLFISEFFASSLLIKEQKRRRPPAREKKENVYERFGRRSHDGAGERGGQRRGANKIVSLKKKAAKKYYWCVEKPNILRSDFPANTTTFIQSIGRAIWRAIAFDTNMLRVDAKRSMEFYMRFGMRAADGFACCLLVSPPARLRASSISARVG